MNSRQILLRPSRPSTAKSVRNSSASGLQTNQLNPVIRITCIYFQEIRKTLDGKSLQEEMQNCLKIDVQIGIYFSCN